MIKLILKGFLFFLLLTNVLNAQDTLWHFHPDSINPIEYSLILESKDSLDGRIEHFFIENKAIAEVYYLKHGKMFGTYRSYYDSGELREFMVYQNNLRHGEYVSYSKDASIIIKGNYKNGIRIKYWAYKFDGCYGRFKKNEKNGLWKCFDQNGKLTSRKHFTYGLIATKDNQEAVKKQKSLKQNESKNSDAKIQDNKVNNPRFRENIYLGQEVYILEGSNKSMESKVKGKVSQILTKSSFNGLGIKVVLENGKKGRVVEIINLPLNN